MKKDIEVFLVTCMMTRLTGSCGISTEKVKTLFLTDSKVKVAEYLTFADYQVYTFPELKRLTHSDIILK